MPHSSKKLFLPDFNWIIVGICFVNLALAYAVWYSFSVFFVALLQEFGWRRSVVAGTFSTFVITHSIVGPFVGNIVDRLGPRKIFLLGSVILATGLALCSFMSSRWEFYLFFGLITAIGVGAIGLIPNNTLIHLKFKKRRGLAVGIVSSGIGIGILTLVPAIQYLITNLGWRMTYRSMAIFFPLTVFLMALALPKNSSTQTTLTGDQEKRYNSMNSAPLVIDRVGAPRPWTIRQAASTKPFWLLSFTFFLSTSITQSVFTHIVAFFVDYDMDPLSASYIVGLIGIASIGGKILWGTISDKIGRELTYTIGIFSSICGMILLISYSLSVSLYTPYFFALLFGMGYAVTAALPPLLTADFFEGHTYGRIFGTLMIFNGAGAAFGSWFGGFVYDQARSYIPVYLIMIFFGLLACFTVWKAAPRKMRLASQRAFPHCQK